MKWVQGVASVAGSIHRAAIVGGALGLIGVSTSTGQTVPAAEGTGSIQPVHVSAVHMGTVQLDSPGRTDNAEEPETLPPGRFDEDPRRLSIFGGEDRRVPEIVNGHFRLPELMAPTTDTEEIGDGTQPEGFRGEQRTPRRPLPESLADRGFAAEWKLRPWAAPNTFANPRYFEDRMLERHGHERFGHFQPLASGARFFATVPMLPYLSTVHPPWECEYTLGYYRPGSCVPRFLQRPPYERRAALVEAASVAGAIIAFP